MDSRPLVRADPCVKILLHRLDRRVDLLAEGEDRLVEALADAIRLR